MGVVIQIGASGYRHNASTFSWYEHMETKIIKDFTFYISFHIPIIVFVRESFAILILIYMIFVT